MPTNNSGRLIRFLANRYSGQVGHLYSPEGRRGPFKEFPYALDNGCFKKWDPSAFREHLIWASRNAQQPLWVAAPDSLENWEETLVRWKIWAPWISEEFGFKLALVVQDGAFPEQITRFGPKPDVIFVGGSTRWKWDHANRWCQNFPRVHIGRVNSPEKLWVCEQMGAESVDGTGWFRGDKRQTRGLIQFLRRRKPHRFRTFFDLEPAEAGDQ